MAQHWKMRGGDKGDYVARVLSGGPDHCAFCAALASLGFIHQDEAPPEFWKFHDHCGCVMVSAPDASTVIEGVDNSEYRDAYEACRVDGDLKATLKAMRENYPEMFRDGVGKPRVFTPADPAWVAKLPPELRGTPYEKALTAWSDVHDYEAIQEYLRGLRGALDTNRQVTMKHLDTLMRRYSLPSDMELFRVEHGGWAFELGDDITKIADVVGAKFTWKGFAATTYPGNPNVVADTGDIAVKVLAPKGTPGVAMQEAAVIKDEGEVLLGRNLKVRVVEARYDESTRKAHVTVEVIGYG